MSGKMDGMLSDPWWKGRVLHFVRHGQYHDGESGSGKLTALGRRQVRRLARYFARLPIDRICSSDLPRAVETADILARELGMTSSGQHRLLREVIPTRLPGVKIPVQKRLDHAKRLERIVRHLFKASRRTRHEVVVCHGNLIRSLVLRVTVGRPDGWYRLVAHHGGITSFVVTSRGIRLIGFNLREHLPPAMRTEL
jgi:broad specificity phosphatase PhoE